jgi:hypothetical protein
MKLKMTVSIVTLYSLVLAGSAVAKDNTIRAKLLGKWQQGEAKSTWTLKDMGGSIHVSNSSSTATVMEFECNTEGKECAVKHAGHSSHAGQPSKVSMWFNGAKLVELETTGNQVIKRRFTVTGDGDSMELETIPVTPTASTETAHFKRAPAGAAQE